MKNYITLFLFALITLTSCEDQLVGIEKENTPITTFDSFWEAFDTHYGLFEVKSINWQALRDQYRPMITNSTTDAELYDIFSKMMIQLNDNHVNLYPTNGSLSPFPGGVIRYKDGKLTIKKIQEDYDLDVVKTYLTEYHQLSPTIRYGLLSSDIGYINVSGTDKMKLAEKSIDMALANLKDTKAIVLDVRGNYGGFDPVSQVIAGRFASERKLFMTSKKKKGPAHNDFTSITEWYVEPRGEYQYTKPVILLTSAFTQSTGETFAWAMKQFKHVKSLGDTTAGSYSDNPNTELYNGWIVSLSVGDYRAADGKSYEGIGTAPDVWFVNKKEDLLAGKDRTLEKALELLK